MAHANYIHASPLGVTILIIITVFLLLAMVASILQVWATRSRPSSLYDRLIILAMGFGIGHVIIIYFAVLWGGIGHHVTDIPSTALNRLLKLFVATNFSWLFSTTATKLSILCLYLKLFKVQKRFRYVVYGVLGLVGSFFVGFFISIVTLCQPFSHYWNITGTGHCGSSSGSQIATSTINTGVVLLIVSLPLPVILKLHISKEEKRRIITVFAIGASICLISLSRLVTVIVLDQNDISYSLVAGAILTTLEVEVGIINVCLPALNPLVSKVSSRWRKYNGKSRRTFDADHETIEIPLQQNLALPDAQGSIRVTREVIIHDERNEGVDTRRHNWV